MFIHLNLHTEYSISNSIIRIEQLFKTLVAYRMPAVAITDDMNLFGAIKFYTTALQHGVKPLIGATIHFCDDDKQEQVFQAIALCKDIVGYRNLIELISQAYLFCHAQHKPVIKRSWLYGKLEGLVILLSLESDLGRCILQQSMSAIEQSVAWWKKNASCVYFAVKRLGKAYEESFIETCVKLSNAHAVPIVAINDVRFLHAEEFKAHETRVCIAEGEQLANKKRSYAYSKSQYVKTPEAIRDTFKDIPCAISNTWEIAKSCNLILPINKIILPHFPLPSV